MSSFPSVISTISNPTATNKLSSPSHSSIESAQNDAISKLENFIGTEASAIGTLFYDIRSPNSSGGGHVQAANKGGTGQTAFTKGDIVVATSASVLSKLAVGTDTQALVADSTQAAGVKWGGIATAANIQNQTYIYARASVMSASVYGVNLSQNVSVLSDGLAMAIKFPTTNTTSVLSLTVGAQGPSSLTALLKKTNLTNVEVGEIQASMIGIVEFDSVSSVFQLINPINYVLVKNGIATRTDTTGSGSQTIAHGLGRTPINVRLTAVDYVETSSGSADNTARSDSTYNGTTVATIAWQGTNNGNGAVAAAVENSTTNCIILRRNKSAANASQVATIAVDATNITLTWTLTGTMPGNTISIMWEAF